MRTSDLIDRLPAAVRAELAAAARLAEDASGELARALSAPEALADKFAAMGGAERKTLIAIVRRFTCLAFGLEELQAECALQGLSGAQTRVGLIMLQRKGIVYELRKSWGEAVYVLPEDAFAVWQPLLFPYPDSACGNAATSGIEPLGRAGGSLAHDLLRLAADISRQSVPLTRKGTLAKSQAQRLAALLELSDADVGPLGLRYAHCDAYGPALALVLHLTLALGLVRRDGGALVADEAKLDAWTGQPLAAIRHDLYERVRRVTAPGAAWSIHLWTAIERATPDVWHILESFYNWLAGCAMIEQVQENELSAFCLARLLPMQAMGWLEAGVLADGRHLFRWRCDFRPGAPRSARANGSVRDAAEERKPLLYVQTDFEIVASPDVPLSVLRTLERMAERLSGDEASVYRLSKASLGKAMDGGLTAQACLSFLEANARCGVPDNVAAAIRDWAEGYDCVTFTEAVVMRCRDKETADWLAELPECRSCLSERLGETAFLVLRDRIEALILIVGGLGFTPRQLAEPMAKRVGGGPYGQGESDGPDGLPAAILLESDGSLPYPLAARLPFPEEALPGWGSVPAMWWNDCRTYHSSTQKEIVRQAIEWKAALRLRAKGATWEVLPQRLQEARENWSLSGREVGGGDPVVLQAGEWQEMQIVLPEWGKPSIT